MDSQNQLIVEIVPDMEIKVEQETYDEVAENLENGFAGFDNTKRIPSTTDVGALNLWTSKATSCLIAQYKKYRNCVGQSTKCRSLREMFEMVSFEMQKYGYYFSAQKCENKWRVLERKYKNLVFRERLKKPGRMRHYGHWEHRRALDEIFNEKKRHMYLDENDFPPPSGSAKLARLAETNQPGSSSSYAARVVEADPQTIIVKYILSQFLDEMKKEFAMAEKNNERRHKEEMMIRQTELEVQKRILKMKEQKLELKKSRVIAEVHQLGLDM